MSIKEEAGENPTPPLRGEGPAGLPVYTGSPEFQSQLDTLIGRPWAHPELYADETLLPMRYTVAVCGRPGAGKREAVEEYCRRHGIPHEEGVVTVEFGQTKLAVQVITNVLETNFAPAPLEGEGEQKLRHVFIIDRADFLVFEPDDEATMRFALTMEREARAHGVLFVCFFDRPILGGGGGDEYHLSPQTKAFRSAFAKQFELRAYLGPPDGAFRTAFFKAYFERVAASGLAKVNLSQDDYTMLGGDFSQYETPRDMLRFLHSTLYENYGAVIDMALLQAKMVVSPLGGGLSFTKINRKTEEINMQSACTGKMRDAPAPVEREQQAKRARRTEEVQLLN